VPECVFLYSSFVRLCVLFRMAVGNQLAIRVFQEGFPYFKYCRSTKSESNNMVPTIVDNWPWPGGHSTSSSPTLFMTIMNRVGLDDVE
jgi:hypothetical protein